MAANRRKLDDKNLEILRELILQNGNKYCLDCNQRGPTYVNTTIGSFVCSKCSGMLRGLTPPHRVKSISMATFTPEEIEFIKGRGNDYCRRVWLGLYEGESVNFTDEQSVKDFMSDKYEKKRYYLELTPENGAVNGGSASRSKVKTRIGSVVQSASPLISILPQTSKSVTNNNSLVNTAKVVNNVGNSDVSHRRMARPVVSSATLPLAALSAHSPAPQTQPPVPDFPVDFSTANIYNSSQFNNNMANNNFTNQFATQSAATTPSNAFSPPAADTNDRYAALADLDSALRQQNMKQMDDPNVVQNKNPFQSPASSTNDLFANKNPFFNGGGWSNKTNPVHMNPFMPASASATSAASASAASASASASASAASGRFVNSNNPFL